MPNIRLFIKKKKKEEKRKKAFKSNQDNFLLGSQSDIKETKEKSATFPTRQEM